MTPLLVTVTAQTETWPMPACQQKVGFACTAGALQPALPTALSRALAGTGLGRCGLGVLPDHRLTHIPVPKPALPGLISWAVAIRKCGYIWRGWLPAGVGVAKGAPSTTSDLRAVLQGLASRDKTVVVSWLHNSSMASYAVQATASLPSPSEPSHTSCPH